MITSIRQSYALWQRKRARKVRSRDTIAGMAAKDTRWTPVNIALFNEFGKGARG